MWLIGHDLANHADIQVKSSTPVPQDRTAFLQNLRNKQAFINLLASYLTDSKINVIHAADHNESDADILIVKEAVELAKTQHVTVYAEDTDILVLLLFHMKPSMNIVMNTRNSRICIRKAQNALLQEMCPCLLFGF